VKITWSFILAKSYYRWAIFVWHIWKCNRCILGSQCVYCLVFGKVFEVNSW